MTDGPSEQRRYDGAPAPKRNAGVTLGDAKAMAEEARRNASCDHCDHDEWEDLKRVPKHYIHDCPATQYPDGEPLQLCPDCREDHNPKEEFLAKKRESPTTYALYECGVVRAAETDDRDLPPSMLRPPMVPTECRCGAELAEVLYGD